MKFFHLNTGQIKTLAIKELSYIESQRLLKEAKGNYRRLHPPRVICIRCGLTFGCTRSKHQHHCLVMNSPNHPITRNNNHNSLHVQEQERQVQERQVLARAQEEAEIQLSAFLDTTAGKHRLVLLLSCIFEYIHF